MNGIKKIPASEIIRDAADKFLASDRFECKEYIQPKDSTEYIRECSCDALYSAVLHNGGTHTTFGKIVRLARELGCPSDSAFRFSEYYFGNNAEHYVGRHQGARFAWLHFFADYCDEIDFQVAVEDSSE